MESIHKWQAKTHSLLVENFNAANSTCGKKSEYCQSVSSYEDLTKFAGTITASIPENLKAWNNTEQKFYEQYIYEQMRLAALFPEITSEIDTFSDAEITGSNLPDKHFLLSFDDGPTLPNGHTDTVIVTLKSLDINGTFFILGDHVQADLKKEDSKTLADRYKGMCVASHGMEHQSHAKWDQWKTSMEQSSQLFKKTFGNAYIAWFRPPYGQRLPESQGLFFDKTILWNIDSQDWSSKINAAQVGDRVLSLMLLWRRGIILFHDIHSKAAPELPLLIQNTQGSGIKWMDCHSSLSP